MRQRIAITVAVLAISLLAGLSGVFARAQNPRSAAVDAQSLIESTPSAPIVQTSDSIRGRVVFDSAGCNRCHSAGGVGSPRYPLDGVGARRTAAQLRAWTQGADVLADSLPPSALRTKQAYRTLKPADLDALVAYLLSLKGR